MTKFILSLLKNFYYSIQFALNFEFTFF
ncbi:not available [Campylobacter jejuni]|nr:not available [Campylobacter jejuni]